MAFVKIIKTLRNNWKKSTFGFVVLSYSLSAAKNKYDTNVLMQVCCKEAMKYGEEILPVSKQPRSVTVILNPAANKRKAKTEYENFCDPLLHLAGISVNLLQTNSEGHAKELAESVPDSEPVIIAGGDGTFCETITGLLRKNETNNNRVIGILPLGRRNYIGNKLFPHGDDINRVKQLTNATMAVIKNETQTQDVLRIDVLEESEEPAKPIYSVGPIEWGAFRDAKIKRDKYWIYGGLRDYATYIFNGYKSSLSWECKGTLKYSPPCGGCNSCKVIPIKKSEFSWVSFILPKEKPQELEYSNVMNENCNMVEEICFKSTELDIIPVESKDNSPAYLDVILNKMTLSYIDFVREGWRRVNDDSLNVNNNSIKARTVELLPLNVSTPEKEIWYNIDNEEFDVKPIRITLLPNSLRIYCCKS